MTGTVFTEFQKSAESQRRREKVKAIDLNSIERRISTMPMMMNSVFRMILGYMKGGVEKVAARRADG